MTGVKLDFRVVSLPVLWPLEEAVHKQGPQMRSVDSSRKRKAEDVVMFVQERK